TSFTLTRYHADGRIDLGYGASGRATVPAGPQGVLPTSVIPLSDQTFLAWDSTPQDSLLARFVLTPSPLAGNPRYVSRLSATPPRRPADPGGLSFFAGLLDRGLTTHVQVAGALAGSTEYHGIVVRDLYRALLRRDADPAGLNAFRNLLDAG